jgi:hypothetical protein
MQLWDLAAGKAMMTLTHHKKAVRDIKVRYIRNIMSLLSIY